MYGRQECATHSLWVRHLSIAYWLLLVGGFAFALSTENMANIIAFIVISVLLYIVRVVIDTRHARWHIEQDKDTEE